MKLRYWLIAAAFVAIGCGEVTSNPDGGGGGSDAQVTDAPPGADADPCTTNTCECERDSDCGQREFCDTSGPGRVCACIPGYAGDPCTWAGAPADPSFQDGTVWSVSGGAAISPLSTGMVAAGEVILNGQSVCQMGAATQTFEMPAYADAEPLVAEVTYQTLGGNEWEEVSAAVGLGRAWYPLPRAASGWRTERFCVGESAYGGPVDFTVSVTNRGSDCTNPTSSISVDHFELKVADPGECPVPGRALNGDAEGSTGWTFNASGTGATAGFVGGVGQANTRGARIAITTNCTNANMSFTASVPMPPSVPSPALRFYWRGTNTVPFRVNILGQNVPFDTMVGTGNGGTATYCLPPWTHGRTITVGAYVSGVSGSCADVLNRELVLDDVEIVSEPACGSPTDTSDPGFESAPRRPIGAEVQFPDNQVVRTVSNTGNAHSGNGYLELANGYRCYTSSWTQFLYVPAPDATGGPAVKFWSNIPSNPVTIPRYSAGIGFGQTTAELSEGGGWTENTICLDPRWKNRWLPFQLSLYGGSGSCSSFGAAEIARFDDFSMTTDESCPTE